MIISGICGSLRNESWNKLLLEIFLEKISQNSAFKTDIIDVSKFPLYNADIAAKGLPKSVLSAKEKVASSDLIIFASPSYNSSISGVMKNIVDWISRPPKVIENKYTLVIGATPGLSGTLLGYTHLNHILLSLGMNVLNQPRLLVATIDKQLEPNGKIISEELSKLFDNSVNQLIKKLNN
jgi:chromate reductase